MMPYGMKGKKMLKLHADQIARARLIEPVSSALMGIAAKHVTAMKLDTLDPQNAIIQALVFQGLCQLHGPISVHHTDHRKD